MIRPCDCSHDYQDREHGYRMRVMNRCRYPGDMGTKFTGARCTVCGKIHKVGEEKIEDNSQSTAL